MIDRDQLRKALLKTAKEASVHGVAAIVLTAEDAEHLLAALATPDQAVMAKRDQLREALMSYLFEACQPNRGDVFGWIDDRADEIANHVLSRIRAQGETK